MERVHRGKSHRKRQVACNVCDRQCSISATILSSGIATWLPCVLQALRAVVSRPAVGSQIIAGKDMKRYASFHHEILSRAMANAHEIMSTCGSVAVYAFSSHSPGLDLLPVTPLFTHGCGKIATEHGRHCNHF